MHSADIREAFIKYFENHGHQRVKSSSLVPAGDPSLLFTNAGMVQFKDNFLGLQTPAYKRATSSQKCVRAGGKHNDLENVGFTARHHTFFEMLGNFSFGDYFKKEAIAFAWDLLTKHYKIPAKSMWITVFETDDEAYDLWKAQGVSSDVILRLGEKENFWAMAETGPCGPCSEIHFDYGPDFGCRRPECNPSCECGRFLEIWNLVFMQFNRESNGTMKPLPKPSVDTGAGLERLASVLQETTSNYDTDLFKPLIDAICRVTNASYEDPDRSTSIRVIADHLRSITFLLADGVTPSNEGRGYVLRRILRRAIRHGKKLGQDSPFIYKLVGALTKELGDVYPEIRKNEKQAKDWIREEEKRFHKTLDRGMGLLEASIKEFTKQKQKILPGDIVFKLYDTFGFPLDLTAVICNEHYMIVDERGFNELMEKQRSQSSWGAGADSTLRETIGKSLEKNPRNTKFLGYEKLTAKSKVVLLLGQDGKAISKLETDQQGFVVFSSTPFYAESGGQAGDNGIIRSTTSSAKVETAVKIGKAILHQVTVEKASLQKEKSYDLEVSATDRKRTAINHTATHLLHAALRKVLGERVKQAGSAVDPARLRFDFSFPRAMNKEEIIKVENLVNEEISKNDKVSVQEMSYSNAIKCGALAFFDEKYGEKVRVVRVGSQKEIFSSELCGGTHLKHTSDIELFKILSESSIASGTRRIEAITSGKALSFLMERSHTLAAVENRMATTSDSLLKKIESLLTENKKLKQENEKLQIKSAQSGARSAGDALWDKKIMVRDLQIVMETTPADNPKILRALVDQVRDKLKEKAIVLLGGSSSSGKTFLCMGLSKDLVGSYNASEMIKPLAEVLGGTGGGRADFAQAGGDRPENLPKVFEQFKNWIRAHA